MSKQRASIELFNKFLKMKKCLIALVLGLCIIFSTKQAAALAVFDGANYAENVVQRTVLIAMQATQAAWYAFETAKAAVELDLWRQQLIALVAIQTSITGATRIDAMVRARQMQAAGDDQAAIALRAAQGGVVSQYPPPRTVNSCVTTFLGEVRATAGGGSPMHTMQANALAARITLRATRFQDYSGPEGTGDSMLEDCRPWMQAGMNCPSGNGLQRISTGNQPALQSRGSAKGLVLNGVVGLLTPICEVDDIDSVNESSEECEKGYVRMIRFFERLSGTIPSPPAKDQIATPQGLTVARAYNESIAADSVVVSAFADYAAYYTAPKKDTQFFDITVKACKTAQEVGVPLVQDYECEKFGMSPAMVDKTAVGQCMTAATMGQRFGDNARTAEAEQAILTCKQYEIMVEQLAAIRYQNVITAMGYRAQFPDVAMLTGGAQPADLRQEFIKPDKTKKESVQAKLGVKRDEVVQSSPKIEQIHARYQLSEPSNVSGTIMSRNPQKLVSVQTASHSASNVQNYGNFILQAVSAAGADSISVSE
jgi:hypothetical protein